MPTIAVKVKTGARLSQLVEQADGSYFAQIKAPPVDGKANAELVALIAKHFACPRRAVVIRTGASSRLKRVDIALES